MRGERGCPAELAAAGLMSLSSPWSLKDALWHCVSQHLTSVHVDWSAGFCLYHWSKAHSTGIRVPTLYGCAHQPSVAQHHSQWNQHREKPGRGEDANRPIDSQSGKCVAESFTNDLRSPQVAHVIWAWVSDLYDKAFLLIPWNDHFFKILRELSERQHRGPRRMNNKTLNKKSKRSKAPSPAHPGLFLRRIRATFPLRWMWDRHIADFTYQTRAFAMGMSTDVKK